MDASVDRRCLLLTGAVGAGKTTTAYEIREVLGERGVAHALIDLDELRRLAPAPADDPFNQRVELRNVAAVAGNYRDAGAARLVLAGVVVDDRARYEAALAEPVLLCRLRVDPDQLARRLTARHEPGEERDWHLRRAPELTALLDAAGAADLTIEVTQQSPREVALHVLRGARWID